MERSSSQRWVSVGLGTMTSLRVFLLILVWVTHVQCLLSLEGPIRRRSTPPSICSSCLHLSSLEDLGVSLYDAQLLMSDLVETQLTTTSPAGLGVLYGAGLLTSFSPCAVSLLPLTLAYLGGAENGDAGNRSKLVKSISYAGGLATTLSAFGLFAALLGQLFGSSSTSALGALPAVLSASVSIVMGLNLLDVVRITFPSPGEGGSVVSFANKLPASAQAFFLGGSSALVSSPCSSPVLTSLLAYVASSGKPALGGAFLFVYSLGYATPVVVAAGLSGVANTLYSSKGLPWINNILAAVLVAFGTYNLLEQIV